MVIINSPLGKFPRKMWYFNLLSLIKFSVFSCLGDIENSDSTVLNEDREAY